MTVHSTEFFEGSIVFFKWFRPFKSQHESLRISHFPGCISIWLQKPTHCHYSLGWQRNKIPSQRTKGEAFPAMPRAFKFHRNCFQKVRKLGKALYSWVILTKKKNSGRFLDKSVEYKLKHQIQDMINQKINSHLFIELNGHKI